MGARRSIGVSDAVLLPFPAPDPGFALHKYLDPHAYRTATASCTVGCGGLITMVAIIPARRRSGGRCQASIREYASTSDLFFQHSNIPTLTRHLARYKTRVPGYKSRQRVGPAEPSYPLASHAQNETFSAP